MRASTNCPALDKQDFHFTLPEALIAQHPAATRTGSRLLCLDGADGMLDDRRFTDLPDCLAPGDVLVLNDTRVIPARLRGHKDSGGRVEILVENRLDEHRVRAQIRTAKPLRPGRTIYIDAGERRYRCEVAGRDGSFYHIRFEAPVQEVLGRAGDVPLPPYIRRATEAADRDRYQTIYARHPGAVAAPTAGLHFDRELLDAVAARGVRIEFITLHVGAATFQPVRVRDPRSHRMHPEWVSVPVGTCVAVAAARDAGKRIVAVGTTTVRALETAAAAGPLAPFEGETRLFIYPGYRFRVVDALITNFHLPGSTLLMLVCALAGRERVLAAYRHAVARRYRFYSYGDAMFIKRPHPEARSA